MYTADVATLVTVEIHMYVSLKMEVGRNDPSGPAASGPGVEVRIVRVLLLHPFMMCKRSARAVRPVNYIEHSPLHSSLIS